MQKNGFVFRCCLAFVCHRGKSSGTRLDIKKERNQVMDSCIKKGCLCLKKAPLTKTIKKRRPEKRRPR
ncbi:MAG TPA: hypothetical protein DEA27_04525 [Candidatus Moranbacteria bacterium]|nr:hypothetical protein [Candidatus Moranbacteria bacterium]